MKWKRPRALSGRECRSASLSGVDLLFVILVLFRVSGMLQRSLPGKLVHELAEAYMKMFTAILSTAEEKWAQLKGPLIRRRFK